MDRPVKFAITAAALTGLLLIEEAHAINLSGAWATHADECNKVFIRKGRSNQIGLTAMSDQHGGGFIVEADRLRGKSATCRIKTKKEDGPTVNFSRDARPTSCFPNVQFSLKVLGPNRVLRIFPEMQDVEITYDRVRSDRRWPEQQDRLIQIKGDDGIAGHLGTVLRL